MRRVPAATAFALLLLCAAPAPAAPAAGGFSSDVDTVQIISANVGGKNVFIPSTIVVVAGKPVTLSIFNTTDVPHGFAIPGLGIQEVLPVGEEHAIKLPALEGGKVYRVQCQLHAAHRGGTLVVLPAADAK
jgi:heme/copper-type cytochrome/quinol oxidase subunit 2